MPSYRSGDGTYGVSRFVHQTIALDPLMSPWAFVEHRDERLALMIPDEHDAIAMQRGRRSLTELVPHSFVAEIFLPHERSVHVVHVQPARLEKRHDVLAVRNRGAGRPCAVVWMRGFMRNLFARRPLPDRAAALPIDRHHHEPMEAKGPAAERCVRLGERGIGGDGGQYEEAIPPNHRSAGSAAWNLDLPADVC